MIREDVLRQPAAVIANCYQARVTKNVQLGAQSRTRTWQSKSNHAVMINAKSRRAISLPYLNE